MTATTTAPSADSLRAALTTVYGPGPIPGHAANVLCDNWNSAWMTDPTPLTAMLAEVTHRSVRPGVDPAAVAWTATAAIFARFG